MPLNSTLKNIGLIIVRLLPTTLLLLSVFLFSFDLALAATEGAATTNGNGLLEDAFIFLMGLFFELTVFIVGIAGGMFNFVIEMFVFNFATYLGNIDGVLIAWGVIRDIANIMLVFGFIFIGINTLLGNEKFGANKLLPQLLLAAVLLNFSLYVTQVVIDTSNAVTAGIYKQIDNCEGSTGPADNLKLCVSLNGITGQVMSISGVSGIYLQDNNTAAELAGQPTKKILFFIGMSLLIYGGVKWYHSTVTIDKLNKKHLET